MIHRPVDGNGDILPVLSPSALLRGAPAAAALVRERLELLAGDWWENPAWGNAAVSLMQESRFTEADQQALSSYISDYIRETEGVQEVRDAAYSAEGRRFSYSCTVDTAEGSTDIRYEV